MNSKKRMMFILEEDYYFITIKILSILKALECEVKPFEDYRRLGIIFEFIKNDTNFYFFNKLIKGKKQDIFDNEKAIKIFCDSKLDVSVIKRVLFFLEKQDIVKLQKNTKRSNVDVLLLNNKNINNLIKSGVLKDDLEKVLVIKRAIKRLRSLKIDTLQTKIFGYSEVTKWEI
ncbi:hypothetical protein FDA95_12585 [Clostridium botulinum]|uniref:hypothetical protein n=1 Tax=Clostridium TaxID=1485 RepID=UPI001009951B|nr:MULTISPECIES: hypothetical protein [Clostridium]NFK79419.1 hypothetical protein [Clostridium botulinum]MCW6106303.1 hypothetical protein [Clostridium sporogenes]RXI64457.1 hypothetical protein DP132_01175 [Clostridium tetani]RXI67088.1 hypothetical protein DP121_13360 [Clostridium tetani]RXM54079.1 hypothetical protein DP134_13110 [Clostridium tetani]